jgi:hypothetical protein
MYHYSMSSSYIVYQEPMYLSSYLCKLITTRRTKENKMTSYIARTVNHVQTDHHTHLLSLFGVVSDFVHK